MAKQLTPIYSTDALVSHSLRHPAVYTMTDERPQILVIPVPLLWSLRVPFHRKLIITLLLCSGLFVITAAIVRVALTVIANPSATNINRWGVRESFVGIITINAPILRPLFRKRFWKNQSWEESAPGYYGWSIDLDGDSRRRRSDFGSLSAPGLELGKTGSGRARMGVGEMVNVTRMDSTKPMVQEIEEEVIGMEINVQMEYWVERESFHGGLQSGWSRGNNCVEGKGKTKDQKTSEDG